MFQQVQEHTDQIWKFQRHDFIEEYQSRSPAPPPFILLSHLQLFIKRLVLKIPAKRHRQLRNKLEEKEEAALLSWETYLKENYLQSLQSQQRQRPEHRIQHISDRCWEPGGRLGRALRPGGSEALCGHGPPRDGPATGALAPETPAVPRRGAASSIRPTALPPSPGRAARAAGGLAAEAPRGGVSSVLGDGRRARRRPTRSRAGGR